MANDLIVINQNSKIALEKTKNLLKKTNMILKKKSGGSKFQFWLPSIVSRLETKAINSRHPVMLIAFSLRRSLSIFIARIRNLACIGKKNIMVTESNFLKFVVQEKIENNTFIICNIDEVKIQNSSEMYDEIFIYDNYDIATLITLKNKYPSLSLVNYDNYSWNKYAEKIFEDTNKFINDETTFLFSYEIYDFAKELLSENSQFNNLSFLENLKKENLGTDQLYIYEDVSFENVLKVIQEILDYCPTDNIGILLPYGKDEDNYDLSVEKYHKEISEQYHCTKYYTGIKLKTLYNIILTTYDEAMYIDFDILILPQFDKVKQTLNHDTVFSAICSTERELHVFQNDNAWVEKLFEWAHEYAIPSKDFPRDKETLLKTTSLVLEDLHAAVLPTEVGNLTHLEHLSLHDFSELPDSIVNLKNLKTLTLIWYFCNERTDNIQLIEKWITDLKDNGCDVFIDCDYH